MTRSCGARIEALTRVLFLLISLLLRRLTRLPGPLREAMTHVVSALGTIAAKSSRAYSLIAQADYTSKALGGQIEAGRDQT